MKKTMIATFEVEVEIEDEKVEGALKDYQNIVSGEDGTIEDLFSHIAWNEVRHGGFCEGVGDNGIDFTAKIEYSEVEEA